MQQIPMKMVHFWYFLACGGYTCYWLEMRCFKFRKAHSTSQLKLSGDGDRCINILVHKGHHTLNWSMHQIGLRSKKVTMHHIGPCSSSTKRSLCIILTTHQIGSSAKRSPCIILTTHQIGSNAKRSPCIIFG